MFFRIDRKNKVLMFRLFETSGLFVLCLKYFLIKNNRIGVIASSPVPEDFPSSSIPGIHKCRRDVRGRDHDRTHKLC